MSEAAITDPSVPDWTLGWRLKRSLSWGDVSAAEIAEHLGYSKAQVSRYLNDKGEPPRRPVLAAWALRCGVPYGWLAYGTEDDTGPDTPDGQVIDASGWFSRTPAFAA